MSLDIEVRFNLLWKRWRFVYLLWILVEVSKWVTGLILVWNLEVLEELEFLILEVIEVVIIFLL